MLLTKLLRLLHLLFFTAFAACFCHNLRSRLWERDIILEQNDLKGIVSVSASTNIVKCSLLCIKKTACMIFTYNETTGSCSGFSTFVPAVHANSDYKIVQGPIYNHVQKILGPGCDIRIMIHDVASNFLEASKVCALYGGHLLLLDTPAKQNCFRSQTDKTTRYWIGLTDINSEGVWLWQNGKPLALHSGSYSKNLNNYDSLMTCAFRTNADCGTIKRRRFSDNNCMNLFKFICER